MAFSPLHYPSRRGWVSPTYGQHQGWICPATRRKERLPYCHNHRWERHYHSDPLRISRNKGYIHLGASKKLPILKEWLSKENLSPEEVAFMGDDIPDLQCLRHVGLPCAPYDACWEAKETAAYISKFSGGYGCGRDIIEQTMKAQGKWMSDAEAFGW